MVYLRCSGVTGFVTLAIQNHRGLITSLMRPWHKFFLSTNGLVNLHILVDRNSSVPLISIALSSIQSVMYDVDNKVTADKSVQSVSDYIEVNGTMNNATCHDIILVLSGGERLHIRYTHAIMLIILVNL